MKRTHANLTRHVGLTLALTLSLGLIVVFLFLAGSVSGPAQAQQGTGTIRVAQDHPNAHDNDLCGSVVMPCETIQQAVGLAQAGDEVLVAAGWYDDGCYDHDGSDQVVYISKTLDLRGGYTYTNWAMSYPDLYSTTIDADDDCRVMMITGPITVTVEGFGITEGNATDLQGCFGDNHDCGGGVYAKDATLTLLDNMVYSNKASTNDGAEGGGVYVWTGPTNTVLISNCAIYSNTAAETPSSDDGHGGGIKLAGGVATVQASRILSNTASEGDLGYGGGIDTDGTTLTMTGNLLSNNTASMADTGRGGGSSHADATVILHDNDILTNTGSTAFAGRGGGVFFGSRMTTTLTANTISGNVAATANNYGGRGGGVYVSSYVSATLTGNTISGNTALAADNNQGDGGGVFAGPFGYLTMKGNTISGNTAASGAGNYGRGGGVYSSQQARTTLDDNTVQGNTAVEGFDGIGGGVYAYHDGGEVVLIANDILSNTGNTIGTGKAGGIWVYDANVTLEDNKILGNVAASPVLSPGVGGGIYVNAKVDMTMTNNLVASNQGATSADGMWFAGGGVAASDGVLIHNTFADNGAPGGIGEGIHVAGASQLVMTDTIISGHAEVGVLADQNASADMEATLWYSNGKDIDGAGTVTTSTIDLHDDPAYADPAKWDYHLTKDSAALDEGIDAGVYVDMDGVKRPSLWGFDIGAYEYPYGVSLEPDRTGYGQPGDVVTYTHTLTNVGFVTDTYTYGSTGDLGWAVTYSGPVTLAGGMTDTVMVSIGVPADALSGTVETTIVTVTTQGDFEDAASVGNRTMALRTVGVGLAPDGVQNAPPGEVVTYTHILTNTGNWTDTVTLEATSSQGWAVADTGPYLLAAGDTQSLVVTVTVPANATEGMTEVTQLMAHSAADPAELAAVTDTTTVKLAVFKVYLPVVLKNQ